MVPRSIPDPAALARAASRVRLGPLGSITDSVFTLRVLAEAGIVRPVRPDRLAHVIGALRRWGPSAAGGIAASALSRGDSVALLDEAGELRFRDLHERSNSLARALGGDGIGAEDSVAIMCRNHRGFVDATLACAKLGCTALYLNTAFAGPQLAGVVERERPAALIYDEEFAELLEQAGGGLRRYVGWAESESPADPAIEGLIATTPSDDVAPPPSAGRFVILTSGTTGAPKGAQRPAPDTLTPVAALLSRIPLRAEQRTVIAAPMFHSWGLAHFTVGLALGSSYVLQRRFDPEETLRATAESGATALVVVPVMLQRIMELAPEVLRRYELSHLRVTAVSGSALPGELASRWMDGFGDNLYNLYGSTEVAWAAIATPEDLRVAPGTAGKPPRGSVVRIVDELGREVETGRVGRIFVGNEMGLSFDGYTGGGGKEVLDGLLSSGDVGHLDGDGRLFVDGRDDEMIVSGGENVFPREVEDVLAEHPAVAEVAVIGVEDEEFGQRLKAFVVRREGSSMSEDEVRTHVRGQLARFKVPRDVEFLDSLPRNATGKVLKRELA